MIPIIYFGEYQSENIDIETLETGIYGVYSLTRICHGPAEISNLNHCATVFRFVFGIYQHTLIFDNEAPGVWVKFRDTREWHSYF